MILSLLLSLTGTARAEHDFHRCSLFVTASAPVVKVRFCVWDPTVLFEAPKVSAVIRAVMVGTDLKENLSATVVITGQNVLAEAIFGMYEPASKVILVSGDIPMDDNYKVYYTIGHELAHAILDQRHHSWDEQHCYMAGPVLQPLRDLIQSWNPEADFENRIQLILMCRRGGLE